MRQILWLITLSLVGKVTAHADDGILYDFGSPRLMHGESAIRMVREVVRVKVNTETSRVYCRFVFHNDGPAVVARIGFPDGSSIGFEEGEKPKFTLLNFRSKVDGKFVQTRLQLSPFSGEEHFAPTYHVKSVPFSKDQTRIIEDWYTCRLSGGGTRSLGKKADGNLYVSQFHYVMASGGSWKGDIGEAVVEVTFEPKILRHIRLLAESEFGDPFESTNLVKIPRNRIIWSGFAKPRARGNIVTFHRKSFKPTTKDDVSLTFDWLPYTQSHWGKVSRHARQLP